MPKTSRKTRTADEIAALALHLCADESSYTTGQVISANGGLF